MTVLFLPSDQSGCFLYRTLIPGQTLARHGVRVRIAFQAGLTVPAAERLLDEVDPEVVIAHRPVGTRFWLEAFVPRLRARGVRWVVDLDDDVWRLSPMHPASADFRAAARTSLARILQSADAVTVSTWPLAHVMLEDVGVSRDQIRVAPNHLSPEIWGPDILARYPRQRHGDRIVIAWSGAAGHAADLRVAVPALASIVEAYPHVHLRFLGDRPVAVQEAIPASRYDWANPVEVRRYPGLLVHANPDILIGPLTAGKFNTSKSGLKWLEAAALGVPFVGSDGPPYRDVVEPGKTGFLCRNTKDWIRALRRLVEDADLRQHMGQAASDAAWRQADAAAEAWSEAMRSRDRHESLTSSPASWRRSWSSVAS